MTPADLIAWRNARGLTQEQAAQLLGITKRYLQYAEAGIDSHKRPIRALTPRIELAVMKADWGI